MNALLIFGIGVAGVVLFFGQSVSEKVEESMPGWKKYDSLFQYSGQKYGVPWTWLKAIALNESSLGSARSVAHGLLYPNDIEGSKSSDGKSWGLMQVTLTTARDMDASATPQKLNSPAYSIDLAARYLKSLSGQFPSVDARRTEWVIKSYNQGPGNTKKERAGTSSGFAQEYWERFQRNLKRVEENP